MTGRKFTITCEERELKILVSALNQLMRRRRIGYQNAVEAGEDQATRREFIQDFRMAQALAHRFDSERAALAAERDGKTVLGVFDPRELRR